VVRRDRRVPANGPGLSVGPARNLRLLCILAHPDDESLGLGGILAKYGAEGIETYLVTATRGEQGWFGPPEENPGPDELGKIREGELKDAARVLGLREVNLLDYHDGEVDRADQGRFIEQLVGHIRRIKPDIVVTFDQNGVYGHPDHIATTHAATSAVLAAADAEFRERGGRTPHTTAKLYYFAWTEEVRQAYEKAFGDLVMHIDGVERRAVTWPHWAITTWIDTSAHWETVWDAIKCHCSQLPGYQKLLDLPEEYHRVLWGQLTFHRILTLVPTTDPEDDLFAGIRLSAKA
jgi:LmbE family N-acetylglucosaminyl deacetylase